MMHMSMISIGDAYSPPLVKRALPHDLQGVDGPLSSFTVLEGFLQCYPAGHLQDLQ